MFLKNSKNNYSYYEFVYFYYKKFTKVGDFMMKSKKVFSKLSILIIIILLILGTQTLAASLGRVTGVKAKPTKTSVTVSWNRLSGATQYQVDVWIPGIGWVAQPKVSGLSKTISGFEENTTYKVRVTGYKGSTKGTTSSEITFKTGSSTNSDNSSGSLATPSRVTGVRVTPSRTSATISWNRATNATQYQIDVWIPGIGWVAQPKVTGLSRTITGFEQGTTYKVRVTAYNKTKAGATSSEITFKTSGSASNSNTLATPSKVTGVKAVPSNTSAVVSWNKATNATQYQVDVWIPGIGWVAQPKVSGLSKTISGFDENTTYKVRVTAYNKTKAGSTSSEITFKTSGNANNTNNSNNSNDSTKPAKVTGLTAVPNGTTVKFTWNKATNATKYQIDVWIPGIGWVPQGKTSATLVNMRGFTSGLTYKVRITGYNGNIVGPTSDEVTFTIGSSSGGSVATPSKVTGVKVVPSNTTARITWNKATNATKYQIDVWIPGIGWVPQPKTTELSKTISGFEPGTTYKVRITAYNGSKAGPTSSEVTFKTSGNAVAQVTNVKATATENAVRITWDRVSGATKYQVSIYIPGIGYVPQPKVSTAYKDITGLTANTTYKVKVTAYKGSVAGAESSEVTFTTSAKAVVAPGVVSNVNITNIGTEIAKINFNKATNATSYEVYIKTANTSYVSVGTTTDNYMNLKNLTAGTTYYVQVLAYNGVTPGSKSAEVQFTTTSKTSTFIWPVPGYTYISSGFGYRKSGFHHGIDIPVPSGTDVLAAADGTIIIAATNHKSYGTYIMIDHGNGYKTLYAHGSKLVRTSGTVKQGEVIMKSGNTGNSTGPHLHFELYTKTGVVDPTAYTTQKSSGSVASMIFQL